MRPIQPLSGEAGSTWVDRLASRSNQASHSLSFLRLTSLSSNGGNTSVARRSMNMYSEVWLASWGSDATIRSNLNPSAFSFATIGNQTDECQSRQRRISGIRARQESSGEAPSELNSLLICCPIRLFQG